MTSKVQIIAVAGVVVVLVVAFVFFTADRTVSQRNSHDDENLTIMSRPSGVTSGDGEDFKPKW